MCPPSSHLRLEARSGGLVVLDSLAGGRGGSSGLLPPSDPVLPSSHTSGLDHITSLIKVMW